MAETVAQLLLAAAREDGKALHALSAVPDISAAILGFHAQQAVEKSLKSVLSSHAVIFRRTHDIAELLDLLADHELAAPPFAEALDELNPFAVEARYGLISPGALDRAQACRWVDEVIAWADAQLHAR